MKNDGITWIGCESDFPLPLPLSWIMGKYHRQFKTVEVNGENAVRWPVAYLPQTGNNKRVARTKVFAPTINE